MAHQGTQQAPAAGFEQFLVPTVGSYPAQIAIDGSGWVWITEYAAAKVARLNPADGSWVEYSTPGPGPWGLAVGTDGRVWVAMEAGDRIGALDPEVGWEVYVRAGGSQPYDVAVAATGDVWFTEKGANKLGHIDPETNTLSEVPVPALGASPGSIAVTGDDVWFVGTAAEYLVHYDALRDKFYSMPVSTCQLPPSPPKQTDGSASAGRAPVSDLVGEIQVRRPQDLALNSSGHPWLTEAGANRLAVYLWSTLGLCFEVALSTPSSEPFGIAVDGNGDVWFAQRQGNSLGWYGRTHPPIEFSLPTPGSLPTGLALDALGCVWYTAPGIDGIGRLCGPFYLTYAHLPVLAHGNTPGN